MIDDKAVRMRTITWVQKRLAGCEDTMRKQAAKGFYGEKHSWAYGEAVALRAVLHLLNGGEIPE